MLLDGLIDFGEVPCRLYIATDRTEPCDKCVKNNIGGRGPNPFINGLPGKNSNNNCALCGGSGRKPVENIDNVDLVVIWDNKKFIDAGGRVRYSDGNVQTISVASKTYSKIKRCSWAIFDTDIESYNNDRYERDGEPKPCGLVSHKYIITNWKKAS